MAEFMEKIKRRRLDDLSQIYEELSYLQNDHISGGGFVSKLAVDALYRDTPWLQRLKSYGLNVEPYEIAEDSGVPSILFRRKLDALLSYLQREIDGLAQNPSLKVEREEGCGDVN